MKSKKLFYLILFIFLLNKTKQEKTGNKNPTQNIKSILRHLWNEDIDYDVSDRDSNEKDSIKHCINSDYKYFISYTTGQNYEFNEYINKGNAVSNIYNKYILSYSFL